MGLRPGGMVMQGALEIGSFAGDINLYLALSLPASAKEAASELAGDGSDWWLGSPAAWSCSLELNEEGDSILGKMECV